MKRIMLPSHGRVEDGVGGVRRRLSWLVAALDWEENSHFGVLGCEMEMNLQFHRNPTGRINDSILWAAKQADF
jgi:hypothetical protein